MVIFGAMQKRSTSHIALFLILLFTICFVQPFAFVPGKLCSGKTAICYQRVCHIKTDHAAKKLGQKHKALSKSVQVITVSCDNLINVTPFVFEFRRTVFWTTQSFYYQPDIHSPPYIQLITPPPNGMLT